MAADKSSRAETRAARQLFLYGAGDGRRITNVPELARVAEVSENTIRKWLPEWEKEFEEIVSGCSETGLGLRLSAECVAQHSKDMSFLRDQIAQVTWECENLDGILARLETIIDKFAGTDESEKAVILFDRYCRASLNKQNLRSQFLQLQRQWTKLSGIEGLMDVSLTREKTIATGKAKLDLKAQEGQITRDATPGRQGIFSLKPAIQAPVSTSQEESAVEED